eukprot:6174632-Amphidinium_carterae.1
MYTVQDIMLAKAQVEFRDVWHEAFAGDFNCSMPPSVTSCIDEGPRPCRTLWPSSPPHGQVDPATDSDLRCSATTLACCFMDSAIARSQDGSHAEIRMWKGRELYDELIPLSIL